MDYGGFRGELLVSRSVSHETAILERGSTTRSLGDGSRSTIAMVNGQAHRVVQIFPSIHQPKHQKHRDKLVGGTEDFNRISIWYADIMVLHGFVCFYPKYDIQNYIQPTTYFRKPQICWSLAASEINSPAQRRAGTIPFKRIEVNFWSIKRHRSHLSLPFSPFSHPVISGYIMILASYTSEHFQPVAEI